MSDILKGETIIYFGPDRWAGLWRSRHQLLSRFAKYNDVWYVEPPATPRRLAARRKPPTHSDTLYENRLFTHDPSGVKLFHGPWWLPVTGRAPLKGINIRIYLFVLSLVTRTRRRAPIVWLSTPRMIDYLGCIPAKLTVYHVVDEYSGYGVPTEAKRKERGHMEAELLRRVDIVIVVSLPLFQSKSQHNPNTYHVPNAVDFTAYADCRLPTPGDLARLPAPIIGYSGLVAPRLDLDLVRLAAEVRPEWSFVFVGLVREDECQEQLRRLSSLSNVYFLGQKSVVETPAYVRHFDICMIPYTVNLRAQHSSPLKLYEYAAASKPIIATDFAAARNFQGHIEIVHDKDEFVSACQRLLNDGTPTDWLLENRRFAENNTWEHRVAQLSNILRSNSRHT